jgi:putative tryptophan/tyrosine transport system substrate-binding protein
VRRREFIKPSKLPTIEFLSASGSLVAAFERRLRELGWIEGRTVYIDYRWAEGAASVMVRSQPNSPASRSMLSLRREVPCLQPSGRHHLFQLVFAMAVDPVGGGLVASLARPGGNTTGVSSPYQFGRER